MASLSNRVISIYDRKTSMRLAPAEWKAVDTICKREDIKRKKLFEIIDMNRDKNLGLPSSVRLFAIIYYQNSIMRKQQHHHDDSLYCPIFEAVRGII